MIALPPDVVRWVSRNGEDGDCAIAAMALAIGVTYEEVLAETMKAAPKALAEGLDWPAIRRVCKALGTIPRLTKHFDIEEDTGILGLVGPEGEHVVYLWEGRIIETRVNKRSHWLHPSDYLADSGWDAVDLMMLRRG